MNRKEPTCCNFYPQKVGQRGNCGGARLLSLFICCIFNAANLLIPGDGHLGWLCLSASGMTQGQTDSRCREAIRRATEPIQRSCWQQPSLPIMAIESLFPTGWQLATVYTSSARYSSSCIEGDRQEREVRFTCSSETRRLTLTSYCEILVKINDRCVSSWPTKVPQ